MSEKEDIKAAADFTAGRGVPETLIVVDLDDPKTMQGVEDHQGLMLARVCIIHKGQKLFSWVSLSAAGFGYDEKKGLLLEMATNCNNGARKSTHTVKMSNGYKLEE